MRILITGPTSFTGAFFIESLAQAGHEVHATSTQRLSSYTGVRRLRAIKSDTNAVIHQGVQFGDDRCQLVPSGANDLMYIVIMGHGRRVIEAWSMIFRQVSSPILVQ